CVAAPAPPSPPGRPPPPPPPPGRGGGGGAPPPAAPLARSTPTLWAYAQRNAHKDTPKKYHILSNSTAITL
ncbi:MAG: hypothetical protein RML94_12910, partial [Bacteroidia bacterium]|nr:hypothetical protein [Bacteroidia bacterium]